MHALLAQLPAGRIDPGYLAALLRACGQADATPPRRRTAAAPPGLAEPLTDRELEVLRLLAAGRSNQRIAHDLVVALDTVKKHVTHVLGKLGAANRTTGWVAGRGDEKSRADPFPPALDGGVGGRFDVAVVEDDRRQLAARRASDARVQESSPAGVSRTSSASREPMRHRPYRMSG